MTPGPEIEHVKDPRSGALVRVLGRLFRNAGLRRRTFLGTTGAAVILVVLVTVLLTVIPLSSFKKTSDRLTWAGDVLVGATLLLAAIAAIVALVAYAVSTGRPDIRLSIQFGDSSPNNPKFTAEIQNGDWLWSVDDEVNRGKILLRNESGYSAKNPALVVQLRGMAFHPIHLPAKRRPGDPGSDTDWVVIDSRYYAETRGEGYTGVQWDGGPTYSIHGYSPRRLPDLDFGNLWHIPEDRQSPVLTAEILAEGYRKVVTLPVDFIVDGKSRYPREKPLPEWI